MSTFRPCILIPTYNNPATVRGVVERVRRDNPGIDVIVIDDHSAPEGQKAVEQLAADGLAHTRRHDVNQGKGGAMKTGFRFAQKLGYTHALQIDADGQHCFEDVPRFLKAAERHPEALILGSPIFDSSAPKSRLNGRKVSVFWTTLETGFRKLIDDPLCGFRVYPVAQSVASGTVTNRMEFDPEIAVRMAWAGVPILNLSTRVRYLTAEEGGFSHFHPFRDNFMMSLMHTRLVVTLIGRKFMSLFGGKSPAMSRIDLAKDDALALPSPVAADGQGAGMVADKASDQADANADASTPTNNEAGTK